MSVYAEDELMSLRMTQTSATYAQVSDADLARTIASRLSLTPQVAVDGPTYDVVQQVNQRPGLPAPAGAAAGRGGVGL